MTSTEVGVKKTCYFVWYHFKINICRNFDIRNHNAKIGLANCYGSAKNGMVGISTHPNNAQGEI